MEPPKSVAASQPSLKPETPPKATESLLEMARRLKEARKTPFYNGAIECRLFRFDMVQGAVKPRKPAEGGAA